VEEDVHRRTPHPIILQVHCIFCAVNNLDLIAPRPAITAPTLIIYSLPTNPFLHHILKPIRTASNNFIDRPPSNTLQLALYPGGGI
jgi:hypothetical protein